MRSLLLLLPLLVACHSEAKTSSDAASPGAASPERLGTAATGNTTVTVQNQTASAVTVYVSFGGGSVVQPSQWPFCGDSGGCQFVLAASGSPGSSQNLPLAGQYLNATLAFNATPSCGSTKAELNVNNPAWYDILDVSLVDGYSNNIQITANGTLLGPPKGATGNENVFGLFPYGCDICVAQQAPPCGISPGGPGCKAGSQYNPSPPCQYQGPVKGGGSTVVVALVN